MDLKKNQKNKQIKEFLPVQLYPSPSYPGLQEQVYDPWVLWHKAFLWQLLKSVLNSSMSEKEKQIAINW